MFYSDIIKLAAKNGWLVSVTVSVGGSCRFNFRRRTLGGLPFCFTAEMSGGRVGSLVDEIFSFVDALNPERVADRWMKMSGEFSPAKYLQAVADIDDVRNRAWVLAFDLSISMEKDMLIEGFPRYLWN